MEIGIYVLVVPTKRDWTMVCITASRELTFRTCHIAKLGQFDTKEQWKHIKWDMKKEGKGAPNFSKFNPSIYNNKQLALIKFVTY